MRTPEDPFNQAHAVMGKLTRQLQESVYMPTGNVRAFLGGMMVGHVLEDATFGTAKTLTAKVLAISTGLEWSRIQGDSDLSPEDVTGFMWFNRKTDEFEFRRGPIFANFVLADELPRAPERAQSGLMESMEEGQVTPHGYPKSIKLPVPHILVATRNPDGLPIPPGVLDRFSVNIEAPRLRAKLAAEIRTVLAKNNQPHKVVEPEEIVALQKALETEVGIESGLESKADHFLDAVFDHPDADQEESINGSFRANLNLVNIAKSAAIARGSQVANVMDLAFAAPYVLKHRVVPSPKAEDKGVKPLDIIVTTVEKYLEVPQRAIEQYLSGIPSVQS